MSLPDDIDPLVLVFDPPLVSVLRALEAERGQPLSEAEVLAARDGAICMAVKYSVALEMDQARGYHDIDAEHVFAEWQKARAN